MISRRVGLAITLVISLAIGRTASGYDRQSPCKPQVTNLLSMNSASCFPYIVWLKRRVLLMYSEVCHGEEPSCF